MRYFILFLRLLGFTLLAGACSEKETVADTQVQMMSVGYNTRADASPHIGYEEIAEGTTFRFVASVSTESILRPSLNWGNIPQEEAFKKWASPYGTYCYTKTGAVGSPNWVPCDINSDFTMAQRNPSAGQRLTVSNDRSGTTYTIVAYSPPREGMETTEGIMVIPYKKDEPLMISEALFNINIPRRSDIDSDNTTPAEMYKVYPLPEKFSFVEMHSKLTFAIYKENIDFQLKTEGSSPPKIKTYGLGYDALVQPFTKEINVRYTYDTDKTHTFDTYDLTESSTTTDKRTLRYSVEGINIFPADYKNIERAIPLKVVLEISYDAGITYEEIEIKLPIITKPSVEYLISLIVSRATIKVTATPGTWSKEIPPIPISVGGGDGTINVGTWTHDGWLVGSDSSEDI